MYFLRTKYFIKKLYSFFHMTKISFFHYIVISKSLKFRLLKSSKNFIPKKT